jgi:hypothetical protein
VRERLGGELAQQVLRQRAGVLAQRAQHHHVVGRIDDHGDALVVLGGAAQHRRPADVDLLDDLAARDAGLADRLAEPVEVDAQHVDRIDAVLRHRRTMTGVVALAEQAAVDLRVQRLQAPVHQFGEAGVVGDLGDRQARVEQGARVPPVDSSEKPASSSPRANSTMPCLSVTDSSARLMASPRPCAS